MSRVKPIRNPEVKTTLLPDGHVVLFNTKNDWAHTLNPTAAIAWEFCDGDNSIEEIVKQTSEVIQPIRPAIEAREVEDLIKELHDAGLLQLVTEEP